MKLTTEQQNTVVDYKPLAKGLAHSLCGFLDVEEAESEAMSALCHVVPQFDPERGLRMQDWVKMAVSNHLKKWRQRAVYERRRGLAGGTQNRAMVDPLYADFRKSVGDPTALNSPPSWKEARLEEYITVEDDPNDVYLNEIIETLPKRLRPYAIASWVESKTIQEIADERDEAISAVHAKITAARKHARRYLE